MDSKYSLTTINREVITTTGRRSKKAFSIPMNGVSQVLFAPQSLPGIKASNNRGSDVIYLRFIN